MAATRSLAAPDGGNTPAGRAKFSHQVSIKTVQGPTPFGHVVSSGIARMVVRGDRAIEDILLATVGWNPLNAGVRIDDIVDHGPHPRPEAISRRGVRRSKTVRVSHVHTVDFKRGARHGARRSRK